MMNKKLPTLRNTAEAEGDSPDDGVRIVSEHRSLESPWVRAAQLPELFCSWDLAYRCTSGGWLAPIVQGKRRTIYRLVDVLACMRRIEAGELPLKRRNKTTS